MNKEQKTIKAIQELVPDIMEWRCERCNKKHSEYHNGCVICSTDEHFKSKVIKKNRDITLEDCLIAINEKQLKDEYGDRAFVMINDNGMIQSELYNWEEEPVFWKPNIPLQDQSDKTKDLIGALILSE